MKVKLLALAIFLALLAGYNHSLRSRYLQAPPVPVIAQIPADFEDYRGTDEPLDPGVVNLLGADQIMFREYRKANGSPIWFLISYFASSRENSQIHSPKHCYPGAGWTIYDEASLALSIDDEMVNARTLLISNGGKRQVVVYWFHTDGGVVTNEYRLKWEQMKNALLNRSQCATFIRFSAAIPDGEDPLETHREIKAFIGAIAPFVNKTLQGDTRT